VNKDIDLARKGTISKELYVDNAYITILIRNFVEMGKLVCP